MSPLAVTYTIPQWLPFLTYSSLTNTRRGEAVSFAGLVQIQATVVQTACYPTAHQCFEPSSWLVLTMANCDADAPFDYGNLGKGTSGLIHILVRGS